VIRTGPRPRVPGAVRSVDRFDPGGEESGSGESQDLPNDRPIRVRGGIGYGKSHYVENRTPLGRVEAAMTTQTITDRARLLTPADVAALFRVDVKTVTRWANDGRLTSIRTLGGHRRFREDEILTVLAETRIDRQPTRA
jgi:excisionase family DNA binding protein